MRKKVIVTVYALPKKQLATGSISTAEPDHEAKTAPDKTKVVDE